MEEVVRLERIFKSYGNVKALDGVSISLNRGDIYGLLGPNGAGKTTALLSLVGLVRPDAGSISVAGINALDRRRLAAQHLALIPDRPHLPERLTVAEVGEYALGLRGMRVQEANRRFTPWLDRFGLLDKSGAMVAELSHGMRQKLVFSAALAMNPTVLVVDEPMVGLDVPAQRLVIDVLKEKARNGDAILVTTHTLAVAQRLCSTIGILNRGRILAEDSPETLISDRGRPDLEEVFLDLVKEGYPDA